VEARNLKRFNSPENCRQMNDENASITAKFPGRIEKLFVTFTGRAN